jgi:hypothetical protein
MIILVKIVLAHLLGDFMLQPDSWVKAKEKVKLRAWQLYIHCFIHFVLVMLLVFDLAFWKWALLLSILHFITDTLKIFLQTNKTKRIYFFADQIFHLAVIVLVWMLYQKESFSIIQDKKYFITLLTFSYALTQPVSVLIKSFISQWSPKKTDNESESLERAGNWIGILERLFVFAFILSGQWEAVGFLLAAKSVFRFGDLKESKDRILTEYVLIGTLLSFGIATIAGIIFVNLKFLL